MSSFWIMTSSISSRVQNCFFLSHKWCLKRHITGSFMCIAPWGGNTSTTQPVADRSRSSPFCKGHALEWFLASLEASVLKISKASQVFPNQHPGVSAKADWSSPSLSQLTLNVPHFRIMRMLFLWFHIRGLPVSVWKCSSGFSRTHHR